MTLENQIEESKKTIQELFANLTFFESRGDQSLINETQNKILQESNTINDLVTQINRRDSPSGQLNILESTISNLSAEISRIREQARREHAAGVNDSQAYHAKSEFQELKRRGGREALKRAAQNFALADEKEKELNQLILQRDELINSIFSQNIEFRANTEASANIETTQEKKTGLNPLIIAGGVLLFLL